MLTVVAVQQGDPVTGVIAIEPSDPALHEAERTEVSMLAWATLNGCSGGAGSNGAVAAHTASTTSASVWLGRRPWRRGRPRCRDASKAER